MTRRVVITGLGALTPIGNNVSDFWDALLAGTSGAGPITKFDTELFKTKFACELKGVNLEDHFDRKEIRKNDPFTLYALIACKEAMEDSKIELYKTDTNRFGVIWASGNGGITTFENEVLEYAESTRGPRFSPFFIPKILVDTPSGAIALKYGLRGVNHCTVSACASSTSALMDALNYIRLGKTDIMLAGGSEAAITRAGIGGFGAMKALSTNNDNANEASRPFDVNRDGFVMGEGAGALILEEYEHAKARGAHIYAELVGAGMSNDAYHATATHPEGEGAQLAIQMALDEAQITMAEVDYVNLHATSTPVGDASELRAIYNISKGNTSHLHVSATKSMTGHLLGAAGAVEAIAAVKAIEKGVVPPTINTKDVDPDLPEGINLTLGQKVEKNINYAISNTFGFGGHNAIALFKKYKA
ncbi:beta-ketoacyl-ACP synthase II [Fulvivirga sediminis]|uniref:3-oxoacyl-[acyl-carrier-protein] synthase 2 n=1 Tax=Fulvivirga sediminis TaxID=2803949 RepID=A0A937JYT9_9BACT|nr:beta-ketoacyl-ACP synthase II [Fulvivirga sediminis]MBL3654595.1 beta-ketoacyl-ACP synthase II [Fulvivirga sediminis]